MIGAARWSWSSRSPTAVIMSGRASTTTYVSAAANAIATTARREQDPDADASVRCGHAPGRDGASIVTGRRTS